MNDLRCMWRKVNVAVMDRSLLGYMFGGTLLGHGRALLGLGSWDVLFSGLGRLSESFDGCWVSICTLKGQHLSIH
jgi:hypothetical protein